MQLVKAATAASYLPSLLISFHVICWGADAFFLTTPLSVPCHQDQDQHQHQRREFNNDNSLSPLVLALPSHLCSLCLSKKDVEQEDCGCAIPTEFSGKPSTKARDMTNHRTAISSLPLFKVDGSGDSTNLDEIIGDTVDQGSKISIMVFLRSLGTIQICSYCFPSYMHFI